MGGGGVEVAKKHNRREQKNDIQTTGKINKSLFVNSSGEAKRDKGHSDKLNRGGPGLSRRKSTWAARRIGASDIEARTPPPAKQRSDGRTRGAWHDAQLSFCSRHLRHKKEETHGSERRGCQKLLTLTETKTNVLLRVIIYNTKQPRYLLKSRARYPHPLSSAFPLDCFPTTWTTPATSPSAPYTGMHSIEGAEPPTPARTFTASPLRAASDTAPR